MLERITAACVVIGLTVSSAQAADLNSFKDDPIVAPAFSWTGIYLGAHLGGGLADITYGFDAGNGGSPTQNDLGIEETGFAGGILFGANSQSGAWVFGIEMDVSWADISGTTTCSAAACQFTGADPTVDIDWFGSVRGRLGYAFGRTLLFATAGLGFAKVSASDPTQGGAGDNTHIGFTGGVGIDYAVTNNIFLRAEYLYAQYEPEDLQIVNVTDDVESESHFGRVAIAYKF